MDVARRQRMERGKETFHDLDPEFALRAPTGREVAMQHVAIAMQNRRFNFIRAYRGINVDAVLKASGEVPIDYSLSDGNHVYSESAVRALAAAYLKHLLSFSRS